VGRRLAVKRNSLERAAEAAFVLAGMLALAALVWHHMSILGDGFWSVATGRWLLAHHALPHADPYSYASAGSRWTIDSCGRDTLFALITNAAGARGLMIACAFVEWLAITLFWLRARTPLARLALFPLALFYVQVDAQDLSARGQVFGDLGFVFLMALLARARDGKRVHPLMVVLLAAAWTNLHLSFLITVTLPLAIAAMLLLEPKGARPPPSRFLGMSALAILGTFLNPYGPRYLRFALGIGFDPSTSNLDLFRSPDLHGGMWLLAPAIGLGLVIARGRYGDDRCRRAEQALLLAFIAAACAGRRYSTELVVVEAGIAAALLERIDLRASRARSLVPALQGLASLAVLLFAIPALSEPRDPYRDVPVEAAVVAREEHEKLVGAGVLQSRIVDPLHWGGYLQYAWQGDPTYFVDGRDHLFLFGNGVFDDSTTLWTGGAGWAQLLDTYEAGVVLWVRGTSLDAYLRQDPGWRLVHADRIAVVYVRARY